MRLPHYPVQAGDEPSNRTRQKRRYPISGFAPAANQGCGTLQIRNESVRPRVPAWQPIRVIAEAQRERHQSHSPDSRAGFAMDSPATPR
jgi:hypothetical protein